MASDVLSRPSSSSSSSSSPTSEAVGQRGRQLLSPRKGGEYNYNEYYWSVIHMRVSLLLLEAKVDIEVGDRDDNNGDEVNVDEVNAGVFQWRAEIRNGVELTLAGYN